MSGNPLISVLIITYNPSWDDTRRTLYSILNQKDIDFEIIIADDGSKVSNFEKIKDYFNEWNFTNYQFVENKVNQGTVKNIYSGLLVCKGKYVKPISPGDYLYDEKTLAKAYNHIKKSDAVVFFGRAFFYSMDENKPVVYNEKANPFDLVPYLKKSKRRIKDNYLFYQDYISGATTIYNKDVFKRYIEKIIPRVKFAEDFSIAYMIACNEKVECIVNENNIVQPIIWYECASGISTSTNPSSRKRMIDDCNGIFTLLKEEKLIPGWLYDDIFKEKNLKTTLAKYLHRPKHIIRKHQISTDLKGWNNSEYDIEELNAILSK